MRKLVLLSTAALVLASSAVTAAKMPKGSFLKSPAASVAQLAQQVIDDGVVAGRYARHYQMPRNAVVDYFQNNLRAGRLRVDYEAVVYTISGRSIVAVKKTLPKGAYVFVASYGQPLLEAKTGNPLSDHLPLPIAVEPTGQAPVATADLTAADVTASGTVVPIPSDSVVTKVLATQPSELTAASAPIAAIEAPVEIVSAIPVGSTGASVGLSRLGAILPVAAVLGGAALAAGGGGGGRGFAPPADTVPEPASLAALALGVSSLALRKLRRRS